MTTREETIKRRALRLLQSHQCQVFLLSLSPDDLKAISTMSPDEQSLPQLLDLDRPEVQRYVAELQSSFKAANAMLTPIIIALSPEVHFRGSRGPDVSDGLGTSGTLEIPFRTRSGRKPAYVLDGQYHLIALSGFTIGSFALPVCAIQSDDPGTLREQFRRIQHVPSLPACFEDALFPSGSPAISPRIGLKELPNAVCDWLTTDSKSPFQGMISPRNSKESTSTDSQVSRAALAETIADSLSNPYGVLFPYRNVSTGEADIDGLCNVLITYWAGVRKTFPSAWGKSPKRSRLMDRVGICAMGSLMNRVMPAVELIRDDRVSQVVKELSRIKSYCHWTNGVWEGLGGIRWSDLENSTHHIKLLSSFLIRTYVSKQR